MPESYCSPVWPLSSKISLCGAPQLALGYWTLKYYHKVLLHNTHYGSTWASSSPQRIPQHYGTSYSGRRKFYFALNIVFEALESLSGRLLTSAKCPDTLAMCMTTCTICFCSKNALWRKKYFIGSHIYSPLQAQPGRRLASFRAWEIRTHTYPCLRFPPCARIGPLHVGREEYCSGTSVATVFSINRSLPEQYFHETQPSQLCTVQQDGVPFWCSCPPCLHHWMMSTYGWMSLGLWHSAKTGPSSFKTWSAPKASCWRQVMWSSALGHSGES